MNKNVLQHAIIIASVALGVGGCALYYKPPAVPPESSSPNSQPQISTPTSTQILTPPLIMDGSSGIKVTVVCADKIYEKQCAIGGVIVKTESGTEVARQRADNAIFTVYLKPGTYVLVPLSGTAAYPVVNDTPRTVRVEGDRFIDFKLTYMDGRKSSNQNTNIQYVCRVPCTGAVPSPTVEAACRTFTTEQGCEAYTHAEFPFHCVWVTTDDTECLVP